MKFLPRFAVRLQLAMIVALLPQSLQAGPADDRSPLALTVEFGGSPKGGLKLIGSDSRAQLVVSGQFAGQVVRDLTRVVRYEVKPAGVAEIDTRGMVRPMVRPSFMCNHSEASNRCYPWW